MVMSEGHWGRDVKPQVWLLAPVVAGFRKSAALRPTCCNQPQESSRPRRLRGHLHRGRPEPIRRMWSRKSCLCGRDRSPHGPDLEIVAFDAVPRSASVGRTPYGERHASRIKDVGVGRINDDVVDMLLPVEKYPTTKAMTDPTIMSANRANPVARMSADGCKNIIIIDNAIK